MQEFMLSSNKRKLEYLPKFLRLQDYNNDAKTKDINRIQIQDSRFWLNETLVTRNSHLDQL